jgi:branched-subunit amino acid aminotransferase/4-amino-4-deoxychorismate lyase
MSGGSYRWSTTDGLVPCELSDGPLLVADSWLVDDGIVRGLERHYRRFATSCGQRAGLTTAGLTTAGLDAFWAAVGASLPRAGRWFPRVELSGDPGQPLLSLRIRPAPPAAVTARVWINDGPDPRRFPRCKGPDLPVLAGLRAIASDAGADDALLTNAEGCLLEAAHAGVLWWEADTLCLPEAGLPVLPSVTAAVIRERAGSLGVPVREVRRRPDDLDGCEVWLVNALHGIRPATAFIGCSAQPGAAHRAARWRHWLGGGPDRAPPAATPRPQTAGPDGRSGRQVDVRARRRRA